MASQFVTLGPRVGGELFWPPFRAFIRLGTRSNKDHGRRKLKLFSNGTEVGYVTIHWKNVTRHERDRKSYLKAEGALEDLMVPKRFHGTEISFMIRQAMEKARWKFYIYDPTNLESFEPMQFEKWVQQLLKN